MKFLFLSSILALFLVASCASNGFLLAKPKVNMYTEAYPAKQEDAKIDIYRTRLPEQKYLELGEIVCAEINETYALNQTVMKAREIGADAIIILGTASPENFGIKAVAIVYDGE